jgi:formylglycine-generating enzyme required for sulfatase activity
MSAPAGGHIRRRASGARRGAETAIVGVVLALLGGCGTAPLGRMPPLVRLEVRNPLGFELEIFEVKGDASTSVARPGPVRSYAAEARAGAYWIAARSGERTVRYAAPLLAGIAPAGGLEIAIVAPEAEDSEWAWIPPGPALIGDELGVGQEDERPARIASTRGFWIGRREVTNADFARFLDAAGGAPDESWAAFDSKKLLLGRDPASGRWTTSAPRRPVVTVTLTGARAYCAWRESATGVRHRLPTEMEWEKVARGPESYVYSYGNVYRRAAANQESGALADVGAFAANAYGVFDLTGNAFEWSAGRYDAHGSAAAPDGDQVLRGGSFVLDGMYLRSSFRMRQRPAVKADDIGFRVLREAAPR